MPKIKRTPPQKRRQALEERVGTWCRRTLAQALDDAADRYGDRPYVIGDDRVWTYLDIQSASREAAARLLEHGIRPRDHVGLLMANYVEFVIAKFAIARIGAVAVPINFNLRRTEINYILDQADCVALITMDHFRGHDYLADLDELMPGWEANAGGHAMPRLKCIFVRASDRPLRPGVTPFIDPDWKASPSVLATLTEAEAEADPDFRCDVLYTSGTTGHPKGAMITHDMVLRIAYASTHAMAREEGRRVLFAVPMYHVFGYVECFVAVLFVGGAVVPRLQFDALDMVEAAERYQVGEICCVPMMTEAMLDVVAERGFDCPSLIAFFNSGGVMRPGIWQDIRDRFGATELLSGYGMTETSASTFCQLPEGEDFRLTTTIGKLKDAGVAALPGEGKHLVAYKVIDVVTGEDLPPGEKGELMARGYCVTRGYYNKPEENARAFTEDGWLHTGDVGTVDAEGYVRLLGRVKEAYRCGGEMVMPEEVENFLKTHEDIQNVVVVGVPDPKMGEVGCAFIVARNRIPDLEEIKAFCHDQIARFKIPKYVVPATQEELPYTATGRARRVQLAEIARERLGL